MNKVVLMGNLTSDPELKITQSQVSVSSFTLAVERRFKDQSGQRQADFIKCVAWRQQAEFVSKYFAKGSRMIVIGSLQTRSYDDKDGNKRTATEVIVDEIYFGEKPKQNNQPAHEEARPVSDDDDTSLPFDL